MNVENRYFLSIIIPVYNGERYLSKCLNSIFDTIGDIANKDIDFEVILIDDGSIDNSKEIYEEFEIKYSNIAVIKNKNHGVSYSRNCGLEVAKGEYVMFVDCDDILMENWYFLIKKMIRQHRVDILYFSKYFMDAKNDSISKEEILSYIITYNDKNIRISGPYSKIFRNKFLKDNNIEFKENIINGEDTLFNVEAILKSQTIILLRESYYIVRHNGKSSTNVFNENIINSEINFNMSMKEILNKYKSECNVEDISKYCILMSIRVLAIRISFLNNYRKAKKIYKGIRKNCFFEENINHLEMAKFNLKSKLLVYLFKYRCYFLLYCLCRYKYRFKNKEVYEIL